MEKFHIWLWKHVTWFCSVLPFLSCDSSSSTSPILGAFGYCRLLYLYHLTPIATDSVLNVCYYILQTRQHIFSSCCCGMAHKWSALRCCQPMTPWCVAVLTSPIWSRSMESLAVLNSSWRFTPWSVKTLHWRNQRCWIVICSDKNSSYLKPCCCMLEVLQRAVVSSSPACQLANISFSEGPPCM